MNKVIFIILVILAMQSYWLLRFSMWSKYVIPNYITGLELTVTCDRHNTIKLINDLRGELKLEQLQYSFIMEYACEAVKSFWLNYEYNNEAFKKHRWWQLRNINEE